VSISKKKFVTHDPNWRNIVGSFDSEDAALRWLRGHSIILEDAKCEILEMCAPNATQGRPSAATSATLEMPDNPRRAA
jgi:hypothetical protein